MKKDQGLSLDKTERDRIPTRREILGARGFEVRGSDSHLIVETARGGVDYWPASDRWRVRGTQETSRGLFRLIAWAQERGERIA